MYYVAMCVMFGSITGGGGNTDNCSLELIEFEMTFVSCAYNVHR